MIFKRKHLILLFIPLFLASCYTPPQRYDVDNHREYNLGKDKVWERVVQFFAEKNIPIQTIEKDSGIIYAEPAFFGRKIASCGNFGSYEAEDEAEGIVMMNVFVRPLGARKTAVTVNVSFRDIVYHDHFIYGRKRINCESKGIVEKHILDYIDAEYR